MDKVKSINKYVPKTVKAPIDVSLKRITVKIAETGLSILDTLSSLAKMKADVEKNRLICINKCQLINDKILEMKEKYSELNSDIDNEIELEEYKKQLKHEIRKAVFKELKELEQEAFLLVDNIIEKDEPVSYNKCLELMDLIESMYYSSLVFR